MQDGANDPQVVVEDDEELENASTNFKLVPWQHVAEAFPEPLVVDTRSYDPCGDFAIRIDRLTTDIRALADNGELDAKDARWLTRKLEGAEKQYEKSHLEAALAQLKQVERRLELLVTKGELDAAIAANLILAIESAIAVFILIV